MGDLRHCSIEQRWLAELAELLAFPTVSPQPEHRADLERAARWLARHLQNIGMEQAEVLPGPNGGPPSVYAHWRHAPGRPTLLCYGHYDVQPAGPLAAWHTPPFAATRIGEDLVARGASDDKGQLFMHLKALESYLVPHGRLPLNVKVWLEGEEEIGSPNLGALLDRDINRLRADAVLISDTEMAGDGQPAIVYALRGQVSLDVEVRGPQRDLHAGRYGGAVVNPLQALCQMIAGLHDRRHRIAVPGVYARVRPVSAAERLRLRRQVAGRELAYWPSWGEQAYSGFERTVIRPALVVQGISGGSTGSRSLVVIPSRARARLSMRLVPDQDPLDIGQLLARHLATSAPPGARVRTRVAGGSRPVLLSPRSPAMAAAMRAATTTWNVPPVLTRSGGTIPVVEQLHRRLGVPVVLLGFGRPRDHIHSANERLAIARFFCGVRTIHRFLAEYGG